MQPKDIRRNARNHETRDFDINFYQVDKAKKECCTIAHLLRNDELENIKENGAVVIHVTKPHYPKLTNGKKANAMYWTKALLWNILKKFSELSDYGYQF